MQKKGEYMQTMNAKQLQEVLKHIHLSTVNLYLENYRFNPFRISTLPGTRSRYHICNEFLSLLYTMLLHKNKEVAADELRECFPEHNIRIIPWEQYVC